MPDYTPPLHAPGDPLFAEEWNDLVASVVTNVEGDGLTILASKTANKVTLTMVPEHSAGTERRFMALITGNASLATNRWKYAWSEAELNGDTFQAVTDGRSGTTSSDYAINMAEANHDSTFAWGVDTTGTDYPSNFAPRPVGGGGTDDTHKYDVAVEMIETKDVNGTTKYVFYAFGSHDGTC